MDRTNQNEASIDYIESHQKPPSRSRRRRGPTTFIYVMEMGKFAYKIGLAKNPGARHADLKVGSPFDLTLLGSAKVPEDLAHQIETALHGRHAPTRLNGEWFGLPPGRSEEWFVDDVLQCARIFALCFLMGARPVAEMKRMWGLNLPDRRDARLAQPVPGPF